MTKDLYTNVYGNWSPKTKSYPNVRQVVNEYTICGASNLGNGLSNKREQATNTCKSMYESQKHHHD